MYLRRAKILWIISKRFQSHAATSLSSNAESTEEIKIPMRIKRGPTDILKALASTVGEDETAFPYKFHDDPSLLPSSSAAKRNFALSKEAGRKAAIYFGMKFPTLFMYDQDEPRLDAFRIQPRLLDEGDDVNETKLADRIEKLWVSNAIQIYERMQSKSMPLSREIRLQLLELVSYYNCDEPPESDFTEQSFYRAFIRSPQFTKTQWKSDGLAMKMFEDFEDKDARIYSAVICGMAKFDAHESAQEMYRRMLSSNIEPDINTYHALLRCAQLLPLTPEEQWNSVTDILKIMAANKVHPNLHTFNITMFTLVRLSKRWAKAKQICLDVIREMVSLKIEPSLSSYYCLLSCHENVNNLGSYIDAVLEAVENRELPKTSDEDTLFFPYTMQLIAERLQNKDLAYRLHRNVLKYGKNYLHINDFEAEKVYYDNFVLLLSRVEETEKFLKVFGTIVPQIYSPHSEILVDIINNLQLSGAAKYVPRLYSTAVYLGYGLSNVIIETVKAMYHADDVDKDTRRQFAETAYGIKELIDMQHRVKPMKDGTPYLPRRPFRWHGRVAGSLTVLCARGGQFDRSFEIFTKLLPPKREEDKLALIERGLYSEEPATLACLNEYAGLLFDAGQYEKFYSVLKYMAERGLNLDVRKWVNVILQKKHLHSLERKLFAGLVMIKATYRQPPRSPRATSARQALSDLSVLDDESTSLTQNVDNFNENVENFNENVENLNEKVDNVER